MNVFALVAGLGVKRDPSSIKFGGVHLHSETSVCQWRLRRSSARDFVIRGETLRDSVRFSGDSSSFLERRPPTLCHSSRDGQRLHHSSRDSPRFRLGLRHSSARDSVTAMEISTTGLWRMYPWSGYSQRIGPRQ